jgi:hypothetical protein
MERRGGGARVSEDEERSKNEMKGSVGDGGGGGVAGNEMEKFGDIVQVG